MESALNITREKRPRRRTLRRLGRAFLFLFFSYPHCIVTLPLAVYLCSHAVLCIHGDAGADGSRGWKQTVGTIPLLLAILLFTILSVGYAALEFLEGWRTSSKPDDADRR